jgi:hypothetical protein
MRRDPIAGSCIGSSIASKPRRQIAGWFKCAIKRCSEEVPVWYSFSFCAFSHSLRSVTFLLYIIIVLPILVARRLPAISLGCLLAEER